MKDGLFLCILIQFVIAPVSMLAQTTAFTYQGRLLDRGQPANGRYAMQFALANAATNGNYVVPPITSGAVPVSNGLFAVTLDFGGNVCDGSGRWLEIGVRTNGSTAPYTLLSPRQAITATPYAVFASSSATASVAATLPPGTAVVLNGASITNLSGGSLQPGTVNSRAFDAATQAQLASAGTVSPGATVTNPKLVNPEISSTSSIREIYTNLLGYVPDAPNNWNTTNTLVDLITGIGPVDPEGKTVGHFERRYVDVNNNYWSELYNPYHTPFVYGGSMHYGSEMQVTSSGGYALSTGYGIPPESTNYNHIHRAWQWGIGGYGQPYIYHQASMIPHSDNTNLFDSMYPVFYKANVWTNTSACVAAGSLDPVLLPDAGRDFRCVQCRWDRCVNLLGRPVVRDGRHGTLCL